MGPKTETETECADERTAVVATTHHTEITRIFVDYCISSHAHRDGEWVVGGGKEVVVVEVVSDGGGRTYVVGSKEFVHRIEIFG